MKNDLTEIGIVLDRSGSMEEMAKEAIGGINAFLESQSKLPGEARLTLVLFDHEYLVVEASRPIKEVAPLTAKTYVPRGTTALRDAIGRTIMDIGARLDRTPEDFRPGKVIVAILTDGLENASKEFSARRIQLMINHQREKYAWEFIFLAANQDAVVEGEKLGISADCAVTYAATPEGAARAYNAVGLVVSAARANAPDFKTHLKKAAKK
jgi:hypothetical protein